MAPAFADPRVELAGASDPRKPAFPGKFFESVEALCSDPGIDLVYVATPHALHAEHACLAARHGKHVLVEKPMAPSLEECRRMIDAAKASGVRLIVGHSHAYDLPILRTRELISAGKYGRLRSLVALNFTDFLTRRRREPLDTVLLNQAPHQVDVIRTLSPGSVVSVRAHAAEAAYSALLGFDDGAFASLTYGGHGHFRADELMGGIGEMGDATHHQHFGFVLASCERADLRPLPDRIMIYSDGQASADPLPAPVLPRSEVIDELFSEKPLHDGEWGMATMEVCLAIRQSSREGKEIRLSPQARSG
jgi:phthalate 4,5-cis-dihydrodiol dehydrogenase